MADERRKNRALSKDEGTLDVARPRTPASPVLPEARQVPNQVPASSKHGSTHDVAKKAVAAPSPAPNIHRKSITQPNGEDLCKLPKLSPTAPSTRAAPAEATSKAPARSRAGSRHNMPEINPATLAARAVNLPRKSSSLAKGKDIIGVVKLLPSKQSSEPHNIPQQQPFRSKRGSRNEVQAIITAHQNKAQVQNDGLGKTGVAGDQRRGQGVPVNKSESQPFVTAPEAPEQNVTPPPIWLEKVAVQRRSSSWQFESDHRQRNAKWPCMLFTMAFMIGVVFLLLLFLVESSKKLASLERTTATSPLTMTATRQQRELIESVTSVVSVVPDNTEHTTMKITTEDEFSAENEEEVEASTAIPATVYGKVDVETQTARAETSRRISFYL
ncbi:hypothetical protein HPB51_028247 [Rhipicephalus microplus]|uniref:Uncharacterized protein n=1 Tax=Rhipicephalus microplus TaxID=6941 RepID=A0A9J6CY46_RHIMP|nr:hypothetical protein HPB51_028247 [Rhipicephalus microplus]